ncbi:MAG: glutaredoxin [bacterium]|nr:glutaredoxin [bacterium]
MKFDKKVTKELTEALDVLTNDVNVQLFVKEDDCSFCKDTQELLEAVAELSDKVRLTTIDLDKNQAEAETYGVDKVPAIVLTDADKKDFGIRFYGIPGGYEFASLIEGIKLVSTGEHNLGDKTLEFLKTIENDIHLQVFVTPTCPHCPGAVVLAHRLAYCCPKIKGDMVEASEFQEMSQKYNVMGVPRTIINETSFIEGAAPEKMVVDKIKALSYSMAPDESDGRKFAF